MISPVARRAPMSWGSMPSVHNPLAIGVSVQTSVPCCPSHSCAGNAPDRRKILSSSITRFSACPIASFVSLAHAAMHLHGFKSPMRVAASADIGLGARGDPRPFWRRRWWDPASRVRSTIDRACSSAAIAFDEPMLERLENCRFAAPNCWRSNRHRRGYCRTCFGQAPAFRRRPAGGRRR